MREPELTYEQAKSENIENVIVLAGLKERADEENERWSIYNNQMFQKRSYLDYNACIAEMEKKLSAGFEVKNPKTIANCQNTVLAVSVKNRDEFIKRTIPNWLLFPWKKIIILDWSSDVPLTDWVFKEFPLAKDKILIARVNGQEKYRHAICRNIKFGLVDSPDDFVMMADAEILFLDNLLGDFTLRKSQYWCCDPAIETAGVVGTALFTKRQMIEVGGFPENTDGWGREDLLFYEAIAETSYVKCYFNPRTVYHIPHGDELRTKHTGYDSKWISNFRNSWYDKNVLGIGKRTFDIFCSDGRIIKPEDNLYEL